MPRYSIGENIFLTLVLLALSFEPSIITALVWCVTGYFVAYLTWIAIISVLRAVGPSRKEEVDDEPC